MMKPFYSIDLEHRGKQSNIFVFNEERYMIPQCRNLYDQLHAMGAEGQIRVYYTCRENHGWKKEERAFVRLEEDEFTYRELY